MPEELHISKKNKASKYDALLPQIKSLTEGEPDTIANLANIAAALRQTFGWFWVGFYKVEKDELILGPFQGDIACTRIAFNKGVCGKAWADKKTVIVPDVEKFPGHIACSVHTKSEIVVPILKNDVVRLVLDVDSNNLDDFDKVDQQNLETIAKYISELI